MGRERKKGRLKVPSWVHLFAVGTGFTAETFRDGKCLSEHRGTAQGATEALVSRVDRLKEE